MHINWSVILLSILSPVLANPETVQRREDININECRSVPESIREDCGYGGITRAGCVSRRCCFVTTSTPGVPWCFHTTHRTTTPAPTTTPTTTTAITTTTAGHPEWLKNLLQTTKWTAPTTIMTSQTGKNRLTDMLAKEIDNELKCQKTNRLFLRLSGASYCEVRTSDRVSCVTGVLERRRGQSACSACTSRNCCYDPVSKTVAGTPAPYCFKKKIEPTIPAPSTARPSFDQSTRQQITPRPLRQWSGIRPEFQPGATPSTNITYQSKRLAYMVNALKNGRTPMGNSLMPKLPFTPGSGFQVPQPQFPGISSNRFPGISANRFPGVTPNRFGATSTNTFSGTVAPLNSFTNLRRNSSTTNIWSNLIPNVVRPSQTPNAALLKLLMNPSTAGNAAPTTANPWTSLLLGSAQSSGINSVLQTLLTNRLNPTPTIPTSSTQNSVANILSSLSGSTTNNGGNSLLTQLLINSLLPQTAASPTPFNIGNLLTPNRPVVEGNPLQGNVNTISTTATALVPTTQPKTARGIPPIFETGRDAPPSNVCYPRNCGHRATDGQAIHRIVGGWSAGSVRYWPWTASFRRTFTDDNRFNHICGATLMSTRWIITAGHCFMAYLRKGAKLMGQAEKHIEVYSINVGRYQRDGSEKFIQVLELEFFRSHPEYDFQSLKHDIAVAKLKKPAMYSAHVQPACMPQRTDILMPESTAWVTGWGETYRVGQSARDKLKELRLPLISSTDCRASWPKHFHEAWICTVGAFNEDACAGDSGGPLVQQGRDGRWKLIGVAIAGTRRCSTDSSDIKPGIYTKVAYYRDFIDFVTQGDCASNF